jgi:hypothetical protein
VSAGVPRTRKSASPLHPFRDRPDRNQLDRYARPADDIERNSGSGDGGGQVLLRLPVSTSRGGVSSLLRPPSREPGREGGSIDRPQLVI